MSRISLIYLILIYLFTCLATTNLDAAVKRQESVRSLSNDKSTGKLLTLGEVDNWVFEAKDNETVIVRVTTTAFDAVVGLSREKGEEQEVLFSIDKEGSNSGFSHRIKKAGKYRIRVHGYQMKGGGNYQMSVQRFVAQPIEIGKPSRGVLDNAGLANFFFHAEPGQNLVIDNRYSVTMFDPDGDNINFDWESTLHITKKGEYLIHLRGPQDERSRRFSFTVKPAVLRKLKLGQSEKVETAKKSFNIWEIDGEKGQFQVITVSKSTSHNARLIKAPSASKDKSLKRYASPLMQMLPVGSKGQTMRYAVVVGRNEKIQLQTYSRDDVDIEVTMMDPTTAFEDNATSQKDDRLPVGGAKYYSFNAKRGEPIKLNLDSENFDCVLRLFDQWGRRVLENDDFDNSTNSEISLVTNRSGLYRLQVSSVGNGGGGEYSVKYHEREKKKLEIGKSYSSSLELKEIDFWTISGERGKTVFINVRSSRFRPTINVYGSSGNLLSRNATSDSWNVVIPIRLDHSTTVSVTGAKGKYDIRVIDGEWPKD